LDDYYESLSITFNVKNKPRIFTANEALSSLVCAPCLPFLISEQSQKSRIAVSTSRVKKRDLFLNGKNIIYAIPPCFSQCDILTTGLFLTAQGA